MSVAGVEKEIAHRGRTKDGRALWRHRPQAGPLHCLRIVGAVRKEALDGSKHVCEVRGRMRPVIAGEIGLGGYPQAIAEPRPRNEVLLVDAATLRSPVAPTDGNGQGIALDRINWQPHPQIPR